MPKNNEARLVRTSKYFELPNLGLESYFDRVRAGQPDVYRTTFAGKDTSVDTVLAEWMPTLEAISDRWPTLWEFENDLAGKVGPLSVMLPLKQRIPDIEHYYEDILLSSTPINPRAILATISEFKKIRGLELRGTKATVDRMRLDTNSGSPYFTKRRVARPKSIPIMGVSHRGPDVFQALSGGTNNWEACAVLGWRGQEGGPLPSDVKQRVVWMFPFAVNAEELRCYQPLIEASQRFNLVPAWVSMDAVDERVTELFNSKGRNDLVVCTDFTRFDQHFNSDLQSAAKTIIADILNNASSSVEWIQDVFPIKYMIPLMYDFGKVKKGSHGMGSGSGGTNVDETLVHRALQYEAAIARGQRLNPNSMCLGDDGILTYPGISIEDIHASYSSHGLEMNLDKQYASVEDCTYLRRWHHRDYREHGVCVGVYSTCRAIGRLCEQERYYDPKFWGAKMVALRQLSIIENVKWHPLRNEFVQFCMKRDKFRLGIDIPGFLDNIEREARIAMDYMPDFLGYTKSQQRQVGISQWWVVQYLKSKA